MRVLSIKIFAAIVFLLALFSAPRLQAQGSILNADPDFDNFYTSADGSSGAWVPFKISNPGPSIWKNLFEGRPKWPSLWIYRDAAAFDGGVYQVVAVTPGRGYHFEVAWAVVRFNGGNGPQDDSKLIRQVGLDPFGGTNPLASTVQWSGEYGGSGKFAPELSIDQYARSDHIAIFLRARNEYTDARAEVFFDHATLTENPGMPPIAVVLATPTRASTATPLPTTPRAASTRIAQASTRTPTATATAALTLTPTDTPLPTATRTPRPTRVVAESEYSSGGFSVSGVVLVIGVAVVGGIGISFFGVVMYRLLSRAGIG